MLLDLGFTATKGDHTIRVNNVLYHVGIYVAIYCSKSGPIPQQLTMKNYKASNRACAGIKADLIKDGYTIEEYGTKEVTAEYL